MKDHLSVGGGFVGTRRGKRRRCCWAKRDRKLVASASDRHLFSHFVARVSRANSNRYRWTPQQSSRSDVNRPDTQRRRHGGGNPNCNWPTSPATKIKQFLFFYVSIILAPASEKNSSLDFIRWRNLSGCESVHPERGIRHTHTRKEKTFFPADKSLGKQAAAWWNRNNKLTNIIGLSMMAASLSLSLYHQTARPDQWCNARWMRECVCVYIDQMDVAVSLSRSENEKRRARCLHDGQEARVLWERLVSSQCDCLDLTGMKRPLWGCGSSSSYRCQRAGTRRILAAKRTNWVEKGNNKFVFDLQPHTPRLWAVTHKKAS